MSDLAQAWAAFARQPLEVAFHPFTPGTGKGQAAAELADPSVGESVHEALARLEPVFAGTAVARFFRLPSTPCSDSRRQEWLESRRALVRVLDSLLAHGADPSLVRASLSHAEGAVLAAATAGGIGLGVDLEKADRAISAEAYRRLSQESERELGVPPLWLWVIKECCFKADPENGSAVLTGYELITARGTSLGVEGLVRRTERGREFRICVVAVEGWVLGVAVA